jgi:GT2 family glycosyltransferase/tetratricopeptide (TPR) repeat protein
MGTVGHDVTSAHRPTVTVVIPAWNAWAHTRRCLDALRPTLRPGDEVVVVDNGSHDETAHALTAYRWVEVVANAENQGFARACNHGAAVAQGEAIVFLNNDTVVSEGWLDELVAPLAGPDVGAVGPRSDNVSGHQATAAVRYSPDQPDAFLQSVRAWRNQHRGETTEVHRLVGFCLAVRRDAFVRIGGFDERYAIGGFEDDDLCVRLEQLGLRLLVSHGSFVHHHGHATFDANDVDWRQVQKANRRRFVDVWGSEALPRAPLVSACLIVKDEQAMLADCLESLRDLTSEVVVYDTGSSDNTVQIARESGARVIEGRWESSFALARNAALAHAAGEWVLSIDADERLRADPEAVRRQLLDRAADVEAYLVAIENLHGAGNPRSVHSAIRLFRRRSCAWAHRLHEQVVAADDPRRPLRTTCLSGARIVHHGYEAGIFEARNKSERNLRLAEAALGDKEQAPSYALMNYGRALESAGRSDEAVEQLSRAAEISKDPITRRLAVSNLAYILGRMGRYDEALEQVAVLRQLSCSSVAADIAEGRTRLAMGQTKEGLALLARIPSNARDDDGMEYAPHMVAAIRGEALASLGRFGEAADVVLEAVRSDGVLEADIGELVRWLLGAGRSPEEIASALAESDLVAMLGRMLRQPPPLADVLIEGSWARFPDRLEPLAAAARIGPELPVARALQWSSRLRARGLADACPLVAIVAGGADPAVRIRAGAAAFGAFGERAVIAGVEDALGLLDPAARRAALAEVGRLAPGLPDILAGNTAEAGCVRVRRGA